MASWNDNRKEYEEQTGGGFEDSTLLRVLYDKTQDATTHMHQLPDLVIYDLMCMLHQIANGTNRPTGDCASTPEEKNAERLHSFVHVYNLFMRPIRVWAALGVQTIVICGDKGLPKIKATTAAKRATAAEQKFIERYPVTYMIYKGCLVRSEQHYKKEDPTMLESLVAEVIKLVSLSRILCTSRLRKEMIKFFFTVLLPREKIGGDTVIIADFSLDDKCSPMRYRHGKAAVERSLYNSWLEADWAMSYWLWKIQHKRGLVISIDGDMLGVLARNLASRPANDNSALYLYNHSLSITGRVVSMRKFCAALLVHGITAVGLSILLHVLGNDYVTKACVTPGVAAATAIKVLPAALKGIPIEQLTGPRPVMQAFFALMNGVYGGARKGDKVPSPDMLGMSYVGFQKGIKVWGDCALSAHPAYADEF